VAPGRAEGGNAATAATRAVRIGGRPPTYRSLLALLVDRALGGLGAAVERDDPGVRAQITSALGGALSTLRSEGRIPPGVPVQQLVSDAERELIDVGPASILWSDESVSAVIATAFDRVVALRGDGTLEHRAPVLVGGRVAPRRSAPVRPRGRSPDRG
jgi:hypothetical protein